MPRPRLMLAVAPVGIPVPFLPELPLAPENLVRLLGCVALPRSHQLPHGHVLHEEEQMDMIRHHHPGAKRVALACEIVQGARHEGGDFRLTALTRRSSRRSGLAADVVGYSRMMGADEAGTLTASHIPDDYLMATSPLFAAKKRNPSNEVAQACGKANYDGTREALTPVIASWNVAIDKANAFVKENSERIKALEEEFGVSATARLLPRE